MNGFFPQENTELLLLNIFSILSLMLLLFKEDTTNSELIFFFFPINPFQLFQVASFSCSLCLSQNSKKGGKLTVQSPFNNLAEEEVQHWQCGTCSPVLATCLGLDCALTPKWQTHLSFLK